MGLAPWATILRPSGPASRRRSEAGELWQKRFPSLGSGQAFDPALRTVKDYWGPLSIST